MAELEQTAVAEREEAVNTSYSDLLFGIRRSIRYHVRRRRFFENLHTVTSFIGVLAGSAATASILKQWYDAAAWFAGFVAVFSAFDLVVGFSRTARLHEELVRRFTEIEKRLFRDSSAETVNWGTEKRLEIEADEPPKLAALDCLCHNELCRAMGFHPIKHASEFVKVGFFQRLFAHFFDFREHTLQKPEA